MFPKFPPLSVDEIYKASKGTCVSTRDVRAMTRDECFFQCHSRNEQIVFFKYFLSNNCFISASPKSLGIIYNIKPGNVSKILRKAKNAHKEIWPLLKIDHENEKIIIAKIISNRDSYDFITITPINKFVEENFPNISS